MRKYKYDNGKDFFITSLIIFAIFIVIYPVDFEKIVLTYSEYFKETDISYFIIGFLFAVLCISIIIKNLIKDWKER